MSDSQPPNRVSSFPPLVGPNPQVLILGSMPGKESLRQQQYYAHPRNAFWRIMGELCGAGLDLPYPQRGEKLCRAGLALWDVLKHCERSGSLDSSIRRGTEIPNEIDEFLRAHPTIRAVCFNGQKAAKSFERLVLPKLVGEGAKSFITNGTNGANATNESPEKTHFRHAERSEASVLAIKLVILPSTSPAHAGRSLAEKTQIWRQAIEPYLGC